MIYNESTVVTMRATSGVRYRVKIMTGNLHGATAQRKQSRRNHHSTGLFLFSCAVFIAGCDRKTPTTESTGAIASKLECLLYCETADDLEEFYAKHSLGEVQVHTKDRLVFAQAFPYSGMNASHLWVYALDADGMRLVAFLYIPTQSNVTLEADDSGSIAVRAEDQRVAILDQPQ